MSKINFEEKKNEALKWCKEKKDKTVAWCKENEALIVTLAPVVLYSGSKIVTAIIKSNTAKQNKALKENYVWDYSNGCHYELKHKLSNQDHLLISRRRANGEPIGDILEDMRLLK